MEILRGNFVEELPTILKAIEEADFISFDYEFTGLFTEKEVGLTDTHAERYERYRRQCVKFLPVQAGICTFKYDTKKQRYHYNPYNFYLFPHSSEQLRMSPKVFSLEGSSIDFLVKHNFDFNKSFYEGIGFGTLADLETKKIEIEKHYQKYVDELKSINEPSMVLPSEMVKFIEEKTEKVREFLAKTPGQEEELTFTNLNGYERKLLFTFLPTRVSDDPHSITVESRYTTDGSVVVIRANLEGIEGKKKVILRRQQEQIESLEFAMGFSKIIEALSNCRAILIGHNLYIDLMHTLHHCISPLPASYMEYKEFVTTTFPRLIDTKYLANTKFSDVICNSSLGHLFESVNSPPFRKLKIEPTNEDFDMVSDSAKFHDAAFDAFITGYSLLAMLDSIAKEKDVDEPAKNAELLLKKYYHRLPVQKVLGATHTNLGGPDEPINRDNLYLINFPTEWKASDIHSALKPANIESSSIHIHWVDDTSAWLYLKGCVNADDIGKLSKPLSKFRIVSFSNHSAQTSSDREPSAKRLKVENGSSKSETGKDQNNSAAPFEVPTDW